MLTIISNERANPVNTFFNIQLLARQAGATYLWLPTILYKLQFKERKKLNHFQNTNLSFWIVVSSCLHSFRVTSMRQLC